MSSQIRLAWLTTNYSCNNKCSHCYAGSNFNPQNKMMSKELLFASLSLSKDAGVGQVIFIGGEPTLYEHLLEGVNEARRHAFSVGMVTNGRKLSDRSFVTDLKKEGLGYCTISLEGSTSEVHDMITGAKGSFKQAVMGLENCLEEGLRVCTETTICSDNKSDLKSLVTFLKSKGLETIMLNLCLPSLTGTSTYASIGFVEAALIVQDVYLFGKTHGVAIKSVTPLPVCNFDSAVSNEMRERKLLNLSCQMFYGSGIVFDYNGDVLPCVHFSGFPLMSVQKQDGTIKNAQEFLDEFNDPNKTSWKFRRSLWRYPSSKCETCFGECLGGCPIFRLCEGDVKKEVKGYDKCSSS